MENSGVSKTSKCARSRRVLSLILGSAFAVWAADPVLGTWELNVAKSKYDPGPARSEEHTSELQSLAYLVCRLLLEKKKTTKQIKNLSTHKTKEYTKKQAAN